MGIGFDLWLMAGGMAALLWLLRAVALEFALRAREVLSDRTHDGPPTPAPRLSVVLAAKDEERNIEACVRSLMEQDYPDFEVIVVDDRSTDGTPAILDRLATEFPERLRLLRVRALPEGWFGKHNAVRVGVAASSGRWLLFTDADCRQTSRRSFSMAMREATEQRADFLSIIPAFDVRTWWERIVQPVCAIVLIIWFRPSRVNSPRTRTAYANGAFMLVRRACYDDVGGHEAVRTRINEDIHLARLAKCRGWKLRVVENQGLYVTRMYDSFMGAFHGWSRIFYGCLEQPHHLAAALGLIAFSVVLPWASLAVASAGWTVAPNATSGQWGLAVSTWALVVILLQAVTGRLFAEIGYGFAWSLAYLVGAAVTMVILLNAILKALGLTHTTWRQTTYLQSRLGENQAQAPPQIKTAPAGVLPIVEAGVVRPPIA